MTALLPPLLAASAALTALAALLLRPRAEDEDLRAHALQMGLLLLALGPLAASLLAPHGASAASVLLAWGLAIALLLRDPSDTYASEAALKLAWVGGAALALSVAGELLLALSAGTARASEQGPALALALDPYALWGVALVLSLLVGIVLLAGVPFHFWAADLAQGAPLHVAPLLLAALPATGAAWLMRRLADMAAFPAGLERVSAVLGGAAMVALIGGGASLVWQRRPDRRIGVLVGLQGALVLTAMALEPARAPFAALAFDGLAAWAVHLALALTGAVAFARFTPADVHALEPPAVLFRRHPWAGLASAYALLSLSGAPGTPGALLWLEVARRAIATQNAAWTLALAFAWVAAVAMAASEVRRAFGVPKAEIAPEAEVPPRMRAALIAAAVGLALLGMAWLLA